MLDETLNNDTNDTPEIPNNDTQPEIKAVRRSNAKQPPAASEPQEQKAGEAPPLPKQHQSKFVPIPDGGLHELAKQLWPHHANNPEQHAKHVRDLLELNRDILRDEHSHRVGQQVRIPGDVQS